MQPSPDSPPIMRARIMTDDPRVQQLLEELNASDATPEVVCRSCPELLPVVRKQWRRIRRLRADLEALFPLPDEPAPPLDGTDLPQVPGYEVEAVLGRGGMGIVFQARHLRLNRPVALKMVLDGAYADPLDRARFQREAAAAAAIQHPNIVQVYDVGESNGRPFFTMEYIEGGSLAKRLAGTPQLPQHAAQLLAILAGAVQAAHDNGIVHRDLKPANVLLNADGVPKISDFGLARRLAGEAGITRTGAAVGTPSYMAPEQARGEPDAVGPAADVYALGAILYELLTGRPPFRAATAVETVQQVITQEPAPPSRLNDKVPRDLETICLKCLQKEPGWRYASAAALADDLRRFGAGRPIQARPVGWGEQLWRWGRRNPTATALLATALALVGLVSGGGVWIVQQRAERKAEASRHYFDLQNGVGTALPQAVSLRQQYHFHEARELLEFARMRLEQAAGPDDLRQRVERAQAELNLAERLDSARIKAAMLMSGKSGAAQAEPLYVSAFAEAGLGREGDDIKLMAARVRDSALHAELIAALDDWASITADKGRRGWLLAVASEADQNPARNRLRQPDLWRDGARLRQIALEPAVTEVTPQLAIALSHAASESRGDVEPLLTAVQTRHPQDFWLNFTLGSMLAEARRWDEAIGYYRAALAVRPKVSGVHNNLGNTLYVKGREAQVNCHSKEAQRLEAEAIGHFKEAERFETEAIGHFKEAQRLEAEAIGHFNEALRLDPNSISAHWSLGSTLVNAGRLEAGVEQYQEALRLDPKLVVDPVGLSVNISDATRTALLAAAGLHTEKGRRMDDAERTRWRLQALGWMRAYLELAIKLQERGERAGWSPASWQTDSAMARVRNPAELAKLPAAEREQWQLLWADVAAQVAADPLAQGRAHAARREWAKAADAYTRALKHSPTDDGHFWFEYAAVLLLSGDRPGYLKACAHLVDRCGKDKGPRSYHVARACTLAPDSVADMSLPGRLAEKELQGSREFWSLTEQGALAYRAGRFQEAVPLFEQSLRANPSAGASVVNRLWLVLAHQRLGKAEEARRWLGKAQAWLDQYKDGMPTDAELAVGLHPHNWLEAHVLRREAETVLATMP
jgi:tetratricopeptide (TPR) repeat protein/predicted Ser/Thr protein kinase